MQCSINLPNNNHLERCLRPWYNHGEATVQRKPTIHFATEYIYYGKQRSSSVDERKNISTLDGGETASISVSKGPSTSPQPGKRKRISPFP
jgi:hypothetical protein